MCSLQNCQADSANGSNPRAWIGRDLSQTTMVRQRGNVAAINADTGCIKMKRLFSKVLTSDWLMYGVKRVNQESWDSRFLLMQWHMEEMVPWKGGSREACHWLWIAPILLPLDFATIFNGSRR
ncbi:hypothetical protein KIL84_008996 [Mauremys mutica]|uniref:Uncharacterized protein n=1 Tax=Mauremys mutica TaxID=74926 RepID=A0A9D3XJ98_9SAUR|nr:hypothetical protein KIL84_008996 [Mauremys mutica]